MFIESKSELLVVARKWVFLYGVGQIKLLIIQYYGNLVNTIITKILMDQLHANCKMCTEILFISLFP